MEARLLIVVEDGLVQEVELFGDLKQSFEVTVYDMDNKKAELRPELYSPAVYYFSPVEEKA